MKAFKLTTIIHALIVIFSCAELHSQVPRQFYYQVVLRDNSNNLISNQVVPLKVSIKEGGTNGTILYTEEHNSLANTNGLATLSIGSGSNIVGSILNINWSSPKIIATMIDLGGGSYIPYHEEQLLSVPYVLFAENSGQGPPGIQGPLGPEGPQGATGEIGASGIQGAVGLAGLSGSVGLPGPIGQTGSPGVVGVIGQSGPSGLQGPSGLPGVTGQAGPQGTPGMQGNIGNGFANGSAQGQMRYWNGNDWVEVGTGNSRQILTYCDGKPTWTTNGQCLGGITALNCVNASLSGVLIQGIESNGLIVSIPYTGGNGGIYSAQSISSSSVTGLNAILGPGSLESGQGNLIYSITGTPSVDGTANFAITIGGVECTLSLPVIASGGVSAQASCGANNVHNPAKVYGTMTDQEGNVYKTIVIGTQEWMAENLKTSIYRNGESISNVVEAVEWWSQTITGAWCNYNNDSQYECPYGKLYNWYAVADSRNLCPTGWHVPTNIEWTILTDFAGGGNVVGGKVKSAGLQYWAAPNQSASNETGFSSIPGGARYGDPTYYGGIGIQVLYWSATERDDELAYYFFSQAYSGQGGLAFGDKPGGFSVRCLRD